MLNYDYTVVVGTFQCPHNVFVHKVKGCLATIEQWKEQWKVPTTRHPKECVGALCTILKALLFTTEGGALRDSKDSAKDARDLWIRDVA